MGSARGNISRSHYIELVGKVLRVAESLREETVSGAAFLASPLFDSRIRVCGSISVGVPKVRFTPRRADEVAEYLKDACRRLSEKLSTTGYVHSHHGEFTLVKQTQQLSQKEG